MSEPKSERMTQAQRDRLEAELAELEGPKRTAVVQAIKTAREFGDLSENFEYHAAKNEQGLLEARIRVLRHRLHHATVIDEEAAAASGVVTVGSRVTPTTVWPTLHSAPLPIRTLSITTLPST